MSKQSDAKLKQGYVPKMEPHNCKKCANYRSVIVEHEEYGSKWLEETELRCGLGGFAVKKMGTCNEFKGREK